MTPRIPPAPNHWHLALTGYTSDPEPATLPDHLQTAPLLWASPPWLTSWSPAGRRPAFRAENPRMRIARLLADELGTRSTHDLIRAAEARDFQVVEVENVIETAIWLTSRTVGK
ncbi:hypothetical protein [Streptomyces afghaniensis]|uniref:hypothetical protein n=1 Tax=Streptomyces afghaniensis TaxID=66865 RepID=UPI0027810D35|nr:hypothetical protein [Streptomyces afghaniensis]MDQ1019977.1 hypothetical protein [Streptomyces afghaniensis]